MFFNYLSQVMAPGVDLNLTVSKSAAGLIVMVAPKVNGLDDPAQNKLMPLMLKGTPQELDANFFPSITAPVQKTSGLLLNMKAYEEQAAKAAVASKSEKEKKEKEGKEAKEKKEKYDGFIKKADELEAAGNLTGALTQLQQARLHATEKQAKTVDEKITALRTKLSQGSLFDTPAAAPASQSSPQATAPAIPAQEPQAQPMAQAAPQQQLTPVAQPGNIQPDVQGFGMFGQPQAQPQMQPQPQMAAPPAAPMQSHGSYRNGGTEVSRENEYDEIVDFPMEMRPPVFAAANTQV